MSFEFGMKGYSFGMLALICIGVNILLSLISSYVFDLTWLSSLVGIAGLVFAILAFINGKKELVADPTNKKAKTGKTIGFVQMASFSSFSSPVHKSPVGLLASVIFPCCRQ